MNAEEYPGFVPKNTDRKGRITQTDFYKIHYYEELARICQDCLAQHPKKMLQTGETTILERVVLKNTLQELKRLERKFDQL